MTTDLLHRLTRFRRKPGATKTTSGNVAAPGPGSATAVTSDRVANPAESHLKYGGPAPLPDTVPPERDTDHIWQCRGTWAWNRNTHGSATAVTSDHVANPVESHLGNDAPPRAKILHPRGAIAPPHPPTLKCTCDLFHGRHHTRCSAGPRPSLLGDGHQKAIEVLLVLGRQATDLLAPTQA